MARAITRGVLLPKDTGAQARWIAAITKDGGMIEMLDRFPGAPALAGRITPRIERRK